VFVGVLGPGVPLELPFDSFEDSCVGENVVPGGNLLRTYSKERTSFRLVIN
jgi:hypothetical protein